ncbi:ring-cleaving dioxygenase [Caldalkalibacillus salinus]|uniref:ring-cleaving dioxygenase n=1 Tax=Caldalkalibacillus salinus TaxID=2803787 RepID=UPI0019249246|nr:ring-cleaving dioxygenase [Caldalkalibacillus salinus]
MAKQTMGIHHISAIVGHPQENVDFYAGLLGLRLVKRTVNFDDPGTYHLYFGNDSGSPGTIMTFFPWPNGRRGRVGSGQVGTTAFAVPQGSLAFWEERLAHFKVPYNHLERFGEKSIHFEDPHGLKLSLVENNQGDLSQWAIGEITPEVAIKGFAGATLWSHHPQYTESLLTNILGLEKWGAENDLLRFKAPGDIGSIIDMSLTTRQRGVTGVGTVHHIAWRTKDDGEQLEWRQLIQDQGYHVTPVQPRQYFNSIYFREHGQILFEIATDPPGFEVDETYDELGHSLKLPEWYETQREKIEDHLQPITVPEQDQDAR